MPKRVPENVEDCRTTAEFIAHCEKYEKGIVLRNGGRTAAIATAADAISLHEDDKTLSKSERHAILDALRTIGAIGVLIVVLLLVSGVLPALAAGAR